MKTKFIFLFLFCLYFSGFPGIRAQEKSRLRYAEFIEKWSNASNATIKSITNVKQNDAGNDSPVLSSERNLPRTGDAPVRLKAAFLPAGNSGTDATWDFNQLQVNGEEHEVHYLATLRSTLTGMGEKSMHYYRVSGDTLLVNGYEDSKRLIRLEKPEEVMLFPMKYGDERTGWFYGKGMYCDRLELDIAGLTYTKADGTGTLVLPENDTLRNVLRVYTAKITLTDSRPLAPGFDLDAPVETPPDYNELLLRLELDTVHTLTESYRWYAEGSRYPVLEKETVQRIIGGQTAVLSENTYLFHPLDQETLPEDTANQALRDKKPAGQNTGYPAGNEQISVTGGFTVSVYPNPVVNELQISLQLQQPGPVVVSLYNLQGQLLSRREFRMSGESAVETVNMSRFARGSYILKVQAGDQSERKVIVKQ
jgi:hypothetical protein